MRIVTNREIAAHLENEERHGNNDAFYRYNPSSKLGIIVLDEGDPDPDMTGFPDGTLVLWRHIS